jgi:hypothetical protein
VKPSRGQFPAPSGRFPELFPDEILPLIFLAPKIFSAPVLPSCCCLHFSRARSAIWYPVLSLLHAHRVHAILPVGIAFLLPGLRPDSSFAEETAPRTDFTLPIFVLAARQRVRPISIRLLVLGFRNRCLVLAVQHSCALAPENNDRDSCS